MMEAARFVINVTNITSRLCFELSSWIIICENFLAFVRNDQAVKRKDLPPDTSDVMKDHAFFDYRATDTGKNMREAERSCGGCAVKDVV